MENDNQNEKSQSTQKSPIIRTQTEDMEITIGFAERDSDQNIKGLIAPFPKKKTRKRAKKWKET